MSPGNFGVPDGPRLQWRVAVLAVVMLTMLMAYSMVMVRWGASWQIAVAVPVSLAAASVQLVRHAFAPGRRGVGRLARRALRVAAAESTSNHASANDAD